MEGTRPSPTGTDRPLLPQHNIPGGRPFSGIEPDVPVSPTSQHRLSYRLPSADAHQQPEADIADSVPHLDEKAGAAPGMGQTADAKSASAEDEAQALDWIVPVQNGVPPERRRTVGERLESTLRVAKEEQLKYEKRAKLAGIAVNGAMFAQILTNAIITGLSASTSNRHAQIGVSAMGAIGTILSAFLVRVRGTREPERSVTHAQNLEKFIRTLEAFILDEGLSRDRKWDPEVTRFRVEFDQLQTAVHQSENGQPTSQPQLSPA